MKFNNINSYRFIDILLSCIVFTYLYRLLIIFSSGAWHDRSQFFNGGLYAPNLLDMINNEILSGVVLVMIIMGRIRWLYVFYFLLGSLVFFTRTGIILFVLACIFSPAFSIASKLKIISLGFVLSLMILIIRFGGGIPGSDHLFLFYFTYPLIGVGRLLETSFNDSLGLINSWTLFYRPIGVLPFFYDYLFGLNGSISIERFIGRELSEFQYVSLLDGEYNAFGTILYPYFTAFGPVLGVFVFFISMTLYFLTVMSLLGCSAAVRVCLFLVISGFLFSWVAPFVWLAPFIFILLTKIKLPKIRLIYWRW